MDKLNFLTTILDFICDVQGKDTEVVVHNAKTGEIVFLRNGNISNRKLGSVETVDTVRALYEKAKNTGSEKLVAYKSKTVNGLQLRASSLFITDDNGELEYTVCINQDMTTYIDLNEKLQELLGCDLKTDEIKETRADNINDIAEQMILDEILALKPLNIDTKEEKLLVLEKLDQKGILEIRYVVPKICETLNIKQATYYKYVSELKKKNIIKDK